MGALLNHLVRGEGDQAVRIADQIRDTFLLEQELSGEELAELSSLLPEGFIKKDRSFHDTAKKLSTAADSADFASAIQHYATMTRACVSCHASYATDRFPSLAGSREQEDGADVETKQ
ncbi:MAG: hypothetical protein DHS20C21_23130 [Gemmatimonadota bacterium]|nr:MAG: hypothetical protein DHS20C21_23130 [Gemmatimonadota bacterium]